VGVNSVGFCTPIMADVLQDVGIRDQIQALVCDTLQVVSYKWLSRRFSFSSNTAKR
jgi:hypothetical protein